MGLFTRGMTRYCPLFASGSFCVFLKLCQVTVPKPCGDECVYMTVCTSKTETVG